MNQDHADRRPNRWLAALLGLFFPGLGQIYNGQLRKGLILYAVFLALCYGSMVMSVLLGDAWYGFGNLAALLLGVSIMLGSMAEAWLRAGTPRPRKPYNRWYVYLLLYLAMSMGLGGAAGMHIKSSVIKAYKMPSVSMEPTLLMGDMFLADLTWYERHEPQEGDIAVFPSPRNHEITYVKRIAALPGEAVVRIDGSQATVPPGTVWVLGDNEQSFDSRQFGPVPMDDLLGRVRLIYFSRGEEGVRWERIGLVPENSRP